MSDQSREGYLLKVKRVFLEGLPYTTPAEAVAAGARSSLEWCEVLSLERTRHDPNALEDEHPEAQKTRRVRGLDRANN